MAIRTAPYDSRNLRQISMQLASAAAVVAEAIEFVEETGQPIYVFNQPSQILGLKRLRSFERELSDSLIDAKADNPRTAETLKDRAVTKKNEVPSLPGVAKASEIATPDPVNPAGAKRQAKKSSAKKAAKDASKKKPSTQVSNKRKQG